MKDTSRESEPPTENPGPGGARTKGTKRQFIVIEVPITTADSSYPKAIFACDTMEEAVKISKQMNADAGSERYGVQRLPNGANKA